MNKQSVALFAVFCLSSATSQAFFEEGNDSATRLGYLKCSKQGDLDAANKNGCNPWNDTDANYSYKSSKDIKKSSLHYNMTAALAVAAGFDRCSAYIIALYDEGADVATEYDQDFWAPLPYGVTSSACSGPMVDNGVLPAGGVSQQGGLISPDFTYRSFGLKQANEIQRESWTFHWNKTRNTLTEGGSVACATSVADPVPASPNRDFLTMSDLKRWTEGENTLHSCQYPDGTVGPIAHYDQHGDVKPGSLAALGVYMHTLQDTWSHQSCLDTTHNFGLAVKDPCGFASGHYAGEFGVLSTGKPGTGPVSVYTPASSKPYTVSLHSDQTVNALMATYDALKAYLTQNPQYSRGKVACSDSTIESIATQFASIPSGVAARGTASGAKKRSDLADSLFASDSCKASFAPDLD